MTVHLRRALRRTALLVLVAAPVARPGYAQEAGNLSARVGMTVMAGISAAGDLDLHLSRRVAFIAGARGVDDGVDCPAGALIAPCTADGVSVTGGLRMQSIGIERLWNYWEAMAGGHRYEDGSWYSVLGVGAGFGWSVGEKGSIELGLEFRRLGATMLDPIDRLNEVGKTHRVTGALTVRVGRRVF